jgi:hypothetical protein
MKIGFTGSREGMSQHQKEQFVLLLQDFPMTEFHHGDCEGADAEAHDIVREFFPDVWIVVHPPLSDYRRAFKEGDEIRERDDYLPRDERIVNETEYLFGAPLSDIEDKRSGSWYTIRYARRKTKEHHVLKRNS